MARSAPRTGPFRAGHTLPAFDTLATGRYTRLVVTSPSTSPSTPTPGRKDDPSGHDSGSESPVPAFEAASQFVGNAIINLFAYLGELIDLLGQAIRALRRVNIGDVIRQMSVIGVDTIPIGLMTVGFSGAVLALYSVGSLAKFGAQSLVGGLVSVSVTRETGPIMAGVVVAARAGSAMTAEIGSMKVTEQIDALRTMAISPVEYLVAPRVLACLIMLPVLTIFADAAGVIGGAFVAASKGVPYGAYQSSIRTLMWPDGSDIFKGLLKTVVFGVIIALIGCREGLQTKGGAVGVGQSTTRSVVLSIVLIFVANFILSFLMFNTGLLG